jgi:murein tripeptide amidase MpaA
MSRRAWIFLCFVALLRAAVPTPKEFLGFQPGDDYKLAGYSQITGYFQALAGASDRIRFVEYGRTSLGKPMYVAFLSAPENLKQLDRFREISRRLALGRVDAKEAGKLSSDGKVVVWIDSGLHASEVAPSQHSTELAYRMVTGEDEETRAIRQHVILMQIPVINPDGLDLIVEWYRRNVGTA